MPPQISPDLERELFAAALEFRREEPWQHLDNVHFLLVAGPDGGRHALTVLGAGGEQYGLQRYAANCAAQFLSLVEELPRLAPFSPTIIYELLTGQEVEFTSKRELDAHDLSRARRCDFRPTAGSRHAWPRFRAFRPNRFPWHLDETGARLLLVDLHRALRWAELAPSLPWSDLDRPIATRRLPVVAHDLPVDRPWTAEDLAWEPLVIPPTPAVSPLVLDPTQAAEWRAQPLDPSLELLIDEQAPLIKIEDENGGAPYFPRVGLCLDFRTGVVMGQNMGAAEQPFGLNGLLAFAGALAATGRRPRRVLFTDPNLPAALAPWFQAAGLTASLVDRPPELDVLWSHLG